MIISTQPMLSLPVYLGPISSFCTGFLCRYQASPNGASEAIMREVLRWIKSLPHKVQVFPSERTILGPDEDRESVTLFVDASWSLNSTSPPAGVLSLGVTATSKLSLKQSTVALSSAEELAALIEVAKEGLFIALLVQTLQEGVKLFED